MRKTRLKVKLIPSFNIYLLLTSYQHSARHWLESSERGRQGHALLLLLLSRFSRVQLCATPQTAAHQAPRPWDSPSKNTGVGCQFLLHCMKVKVRSLSRVQLFETPWTAAYQAPLSMGFPRQEYWSGVPLPSPTVHPCVNKY